MRIKVKKSSMKTKLAKAEDEDHIKNIDHEEEKRRAPASQKKDIEL